jgi:hypothetical protein
MEWDLWGVTVIAVCVLLAAAVVAISVFLWRRFGRIDNGPGPE